MVIIVNNEEECYPSLDTLSEFEIDYEVMDDGKLAIKLDEEKVRIVENYDITRTKHLSSNPHNDPSLSYFLIKGHRIVASGNLNAIDGDNYVCDGPFRVFSKFNVSTFDYTAASEIDATEKDYLNEKMLSSTEKATRVRK